MANIELYRNNNYFLAEIKLRLTRMRLQTSIFLDFRTETAIAMKCIQLVGGQRFWTENILLVLPSFYFFRFLTRTQLVSWNLQLEFSQQMREWQLSRIQSVKGVNYKDQKRGQFWKVNWFFCYYRGATCYLYQWPHLSSWRSIPIDERTVYPISNAAVTSSATPLTLRLLKGGCQM